MGQADLWESLAQARERVWAALRAGKAVICPVCDQHAKMYDRKLNNGIAWSLVLIIKYIDMAPSRPWYDDGWLHVEDCFKACEPKFDCHDFAKAKYWGLLTPKTGIRLDGSRRLGWYRPTERGRAFARGALRVPRTAKTYNDEVLGFEGPDVTMRECLSKDNAFNYDELMRNMPDGPAA